MSKRKRRQADKRTWEYNEGDELEKGTGVTYSYDELGERSKKN